MAIINPYYDIGDLVKIDYKFIGLSFLKRNKKDHKIFLNLTKKEKTRNYLK